MAGDGGSRGTAAIWIVAAVLGGIALFRLAGAEGGGGAGSPVRIERGGGAVGAASSAGERRASPSGIYVHVAGAVRRPGLVRVPASARVALALARAGGPLRKAELSGVNLAATLEDGQQVVVPMRGSAPAGATPPTAGAAPGAAGVPKLSLGAATADQLDEIDGIGPTLAERIIEYRTEQGGLSSLDELSEVEGIGEKRLETLREALQP